jgi:hypothetical protein
MKCTRCGGCCLAGPCFVICFGKEQYVQVNGLRVHKCPYLAFDKDKAICNAMAEIHVTGECSSVFKIKSIEYYDKYLKVKDRI